MRHCRKLYERRLLYVQMTRLQSIGEKSDERDEKEEKKGNTNRSGGMDDKNDAGGADETEEELDISLANGVEESVDEEERNGETSQAVAACEAR